MTTIKRIEETEGQYIVIETVPAYERTVVTGLSKDMAEEIVEEDQRIEKVGRFYAVIETVPAEDRVVAWMPTRELAEECL